VFDTLRNTGDLDRYRQYIEDNLERIERCEGWTPICFEEFCESEENENYKG
jgi:hypothetical protein